MVLKGLKTTVILFCLLLGIARSNSYAQPLKFEHITLEQGLAHGTVFTILQDRAGFIWLGTANGLQKYDGYQFTNYQQDNDDPHSLSDNNITALYEDAAGRLWVGTRYGLNYMDRQHKLFYRYLREDNDGQPTARVLKICADKQARLWVLTEAGLYRFDEPGNHFIKINNLPLHAERDKKHKVLLADRQGGIWLGLEEGLCEYDERTDTFIFHPISGQQKIENFFSNHIYEDETGLIWIGGVNYIFCFDRKREEFKNYSLTAAAPGHPSKVDCYDFCEDQGGGFWLATNNGLANFDRRTGKFQWYLHDPNDPYSLSFNLLATVFCDRSGTIWIGTGANGINKVNPTARKFLHYYHVPNDPFSLSDNFVASFLEDREGTLWVGTFQSGLDKFDRANEKFIHYMHDPQRRDSLGGNEVRVMLEDRRGQFWIGNAAAGLTRFDRATNSFHPFPLKDPRNGATPNVRNLCEDRQERLWIGTNSGLFCLDKERQHVSYFFHDPQVADSLSNDGIVSIYEDQEGTLWIGTRNGLNRFDATTGKFRSYRHIANDAGSIVGNVVYSFHETRTGLWLGTDTGLSKLDKSTGLFTNLTVKDGLPNNIIYGILEDERGSLWLSTNRGICQYDLAANKILIYSLSDGLQGYEFNSGANYKTRRGEMLFGGIKGFNLFFPAAIKDSPYQPPVFITGIKVLDRPMEIQPAVNLSYRDNIVEFNFASLDYTHPENNQYKYRLEGIENDWVQARSNRFVRYPNLAPGRYLFRVKGTNSDGVWSDLEARMEIIIQPPFWQTLWFRAAAGLLLAALLLSAYKLRMMRIEAQKKVLEAMVLQRTTELSEKKEELECTNTIIQTQRDTLQEVNERLNQALIETEQQKHKVEAANRAKTLFLTNMSHELRTPFNSILGFAQIMRRQNHLDPEDRNHLEIIYRSGEQLLALINDVLSLSKIEEGKMILKENTFNIKALLQGIKDIFGARARSKGIALHIQDTDKLTDYLFGDENKLRQVLINLIGNAIKFTEQGSVSLHVSWENGKATFVITDTGYGIDTEELDKLFQPFFQTESGRLATEGTGLGLAISYNFIHIMGGEIKVNSTRGVGTSFEFSIPLPVTSETIVLAEKKRVIGLQPGQQQYRVLIVDDKLENRVILSKMLTSVGFNVREAANGSEAVTQFLSYAPHLICMDWRMPVMDGLAATQKIRALVRERSIDSDKNDQSLINPKIIAVSGSVFEDQREQVLSAGCDDFLAKPFHESELYEIIKKYLGVEYQYEECGGVAEGETDLNTAMTIQHLSNCPAELLIKLKKQLVGGYIGNAGDVVDEIGKWDPQLARKFQKMLKSYQLREIQEIIEAGLVDTV